MGKTEQFSVGPGRRVVEKIHLFSLSLKLGGFMVYDCDQPSQRLSNSGAGTQGPAGQGSKKNWIRVFSDYLAHICQKEQGDKGELA